MKDMKFEDAMKRLEKIVEELEGGGLGLEESLARYEEGVELSQFCSKKLNEAQKKVQILSRKSGGGLEAAPFDEGRIEADAQPAPKKKTNPCLGRQAKFKEETLF